MLRLPSNGATNYVLNDHECHPWQCVPRDPPHLAHFQAVRRQIRVICKRETHGLAYIFIWLIYLKLEIGKYFFNLLTSQCPICVKLCRDFNSLSVNCFNDFTLTPILCKDVSWRKAVPSDQMVNKDTPRCSLSPNIGSIMETLRAVGHGIPLDNWLFCVFFRFLVIDREWITVPTYYIQTNEPLKVWKWCLKVC